MERAGAFLGVMAAAVVLAYGAVLAASPQRHAVIIGINDYADPAIPDLRYAENDAKAVYETLTDPRIGQFPKENVKLILGRDATNDNIKSALHDLQAVGKDDLVVIFYSGHGAKAGDEAFWVTQAAKAAKLDATALPNTEIRKFLDKIPSQRLVILLDCCYAASTVKKSLSGRREELFGLFAGKGRVTIAGSADNQEALEYESQQAGIFTWFLTQGLRGAADNNEDGVVTFDELWNYLCENVRRASIKQGGLHEPVLITEGGLTSQFLLAYNPNARTANEKLCRNLAKLFDESKITLKQFDLGINLLSKPSLDPNEKELREAFVALSEGKLPPSLLNRVLAPLTHPDVSGPATGTGKLTIAVLPFAVLGDIKVKDAGAMLAESLLPEFRDKYEIIDQTKLRSFLHQDDLTLAGLVDSLDARGGQTKGASKAVKLRAVRLLVIGTVMGSPSGNLSVTARLSDWQNGSVAPSLIAQVEADNWDDLVRKLPVLAVKLSGFTLPPSVGPNIVLPPEGNSIQECLVQVEAIRTELNRLLETMTDSHPTIVRYREELRQRVAALRKDIGDRIAQLRTADERLAKDYKESTPPRQAIADEIASLEKSDQLLALPEGIRQIRLHLGENVVLRLARIPAGKFLMGSPSGDANRQRWEAPQHEVTISRPFYLGVYPVTRAQFAVFVKASGYRTDAERAGFAYAWKGRGFDRSVDTSWTNPGFAQISGEHPVVAVSYNDAVAFCAWLSRKSGKRVFLPSEAQWEYACRAGSSTRYSYGDDPECANLGDYAWFNRNSQMTTHPVGEKKPNLWGLYDMHGHAYQWCNDWFDENYYVSAPTTDPAGPSKGTLRVLRGGAFSEGPRDCRSANRYWSVPIAAYVSYGFRVAADATDGD